MASTSRASRQINASKESIERRLAGARIDRGRRHLEHVVGAAGQTWDSLDGTFAHVRDASNLHYLGLVPD